MRLLLFLLLLLFGEGLFGDLCFAFFPPFEYIDYAALKGTLDSMTKGLSIELASSGIRVNAVRPALIDTDIHTDSNQPGRVQQKKHLIPLQQIGTTQDVAHAVLYLLSDKADFITGSFIDVSGGL